MPEHLELRRMTTQIGIWVGGAMVLIALMLTSLVLWSTYQADLAAIQRQQQLSTAVLRENIAQVAHEQEAATTWDDSVVALKRQVPDTEFMERNWGLWFFNYKHHDRVFIVDSGNRPIFVRAAGRPVPLQSFYQGPVSVLVPLIAQLRKQMRGLVEKGAPAVAAGVTNLAVIDGRPAIVSVKPIISETGKTRQVPGTEFVHVSVRNLDGTFMKRLAERYAIEGARFSFKPSSSTNEASAQLIANDGKTIGYLVWTPFRPGSAVMRVVGFALALSLLLMVGIVMLLIRRIRKSTLELHTSRAHAQHLALHDSLTGLANRALFDDRLDYSLASNRRAGASTALLYLDLDRFKNVNDTLGHPAGDDLIRQLGARLKGLLRESDTAARLGGDEFAIIQSDVGTPVDTEILCMRVVEEVNRPFDIGGTLVNVGVSIGVASTCAGGSDRVELSRKADIALYSAKAAGRGRYVFFAPAMDEHVRSRQEIEADLRSALASGDQLEVNYQPLYSARTKQVTGAEALVRWRHPSKGLITPLGFISVAEEAGLIEELGEWVLAKACNAAREWRISTISVNVSAVQLRNPNFAATVKTIMKEAKLDPHRLELEITETCLMQNVSVCASNLAALRAHGVRIALDDFGTGYSSFNRLLEYRVDRVKIDQSFINSIGEAGGGSSIVQAIVDLALATGIDVTAEGVETNEQSRFLTEVGCQSLQGFLMSHPMSETEFGTLLTSEQAIR